MSKSRIIIAGITAIVAIGASPSGATAQIASQARVPSPDVCVSAQAGQTTRSWCRSRVQVRVRRRPRVSPPRVGRPRVRPGRVTKPSVRVRSRPGRVAVEYRAPRAENPQVTPASVQPGSADPGEYGVDPGVR